MIFQDSSAVDHILGFAPQMVLLLVLDDLIYHKGADVSKFISTKDGRKLEVKRAISSWAL